MEESEFRVIQGLVDALPFYVLLIDAEHRILLINRAAIAALGKSPSELLGHYCPRVVHGLDEPYPGCPLEEAVSTGRPVEKEVFDPLTHRWISSSVYITELLSRDGHRIFLHTIRDISEKRRTEEERAKLQEQLVRAQKLEGIGRLAGGIAHDFNNLLTLILNYANFVTSALEENSPVREDVEKIRRAGNRAAALTRQLLAFSRRELVEPRVLDVNEVVKDVGKLLRRTIGEDIELNTELCPEIWRVKVDPGQLEQVLVNLAVNAKDAMPRGGRLVVKTERIIFDEEKRSLRAGVTPGRYVGLLVSDTGVGMAEDVLAHIFEPFFTTKDRGKGTGLGLPTVYGIVTQAGGGVEVESDLDHGSTFKIYLPATDEPFTEERAAILPQDLRGRGETILVVDDDEPLRTLVVRLLAGADYRVLEARDGSAALLRAQRHKENIALLLTDMVLQGISGQELASLFRQLRPEARILFMSGYPDLDIARHGALAPGTAFLQKPFTEERLLRSIRKALLPPPSWEMRDLGAGI